MTNSGLLVLCLVLWAASRMFRQTDTIYKVYIKYSTGQKSGYLEVKIG